jgi:predicted HicB family RNase H-like nuclease
MAKPSGKTQIRILPELHAHLIRIAEKEGKSLNSLIETLLAGGSNFRLPKK